MSENKKTEKTNKEHLAKINKIDTNRALLRRRRTEKLKKRFIELYFECGGNVSLICEKIGISRTIFYKWLKNDSRFRKALEREQEALLDFAEHKLISLINEKNLGAITFFLRTRGKHRGYTERTEVEHSGEVTVVKVISAVPRPKKEENERDSS
jgi:transposase-like protein